MASLNLTFEQKRKAAYKSAAAYFQDTPKLGSVYDQDCGGSEYSYRVEQARENQAKEFRWVERRNAPIMALLRALEECTSEEDVRRLILDKMPLPIKNNLLGGQIDWKHIGQVIERLSLDVRDNVSYQADALRAIYFTFWPKG